MTSKDYSEVFYNRIENFYFRLYRLSKKENYIYHEKVDINTQSHSVIHKYKEMTYSEAMRYVNPNKKMRKVTSYKSKMDCRNALEYIISVSDVTKIYKKEKKTDEILKLYYNANTRFIDINYMDEGFEKLDENTYLVIEIGQKANVKYYVEEKRIITIYK